MTSPSSTSACKPTQSRQRRRAHLTASRRISNKISRRHLRQPLVARNANSTNDVQQEQPTPRIPLSVQLPRTLPRPQRCEINREFINATYPDLVDVPTEYIRTTALAATGPECVYLTIFHSPLYLPILHFPFQHVRSSCPCSGSTFHWLASEGA